MNEPRKESPITHVKGRIESIVMDYAGELNNEHTRQSMEDKLYRMLCKYVGYGDIDGFSVKVKSSKVDAVFATHGQYYPQTIMLMGILKQPVMTLCGLCEQTKCICGSAAHTMSTTELVSPPHRPTQDSLTPDERQQLKDMSIRIKQQLEVESATEANLHAYERAMKVVD